MLRGEKAHVSKDGGGEDNAFLLIHCPSCPCNPVYRLGQYAQGVHAYEHRRCTHLGRKGGGEMHLRT